MELIPNHTSDQHPWFQASRDPQHPDHATYRDWYVWSDTDQKYQDTRIIFLDTEASNWTFDPVRGQYFWHRFFHHQPDLNYDNPEVQKAMLRVVQFWIDQGADGIRVDAPRVSVRARRTNCENLPKTHAYLKRLRAFVDAYAPGTMLLSEANQWPEDVLPYFGDGDEVHMNFHFPLMPRLFMALAKADRTPLVEVLKRTPDLPEGCQWATFLRCHDELTLEMVTPAEREFMWNFYAPEPRMRLNLGIRRRLAPLLDNDQRRLRLAHSLLLTFIGSPVLYYGDEIGMGDNIWLDDRNGVRTPMQWNDQACAGFSAQQADRLCVPVIDDDRFGYQRLNVKAQQADPESLLNWLKHALRVRREHPAFGRGSFDWIAGGSQAVAVYWRTLDNDRVLVLHNLSDQLNRSVGRSTAGLDRVIDSIPHYAARSTSTLSIFVARAGMSVPDVISHGEMDAGALSVVVSECIIIPSSQGKIIMASVTFENVVKRYGNVTAVRTSIWRSPTRNSWSSSALRAAARPPACACWPGWKTSARARSTSAIGWSTMCRRKIATSRWCSSRMRCTRT